MSYEDSHIVILVFLFLYGPFITDPGIEFPLSVLGNSQSLFVRHYLYYAMETSAMKTKQPKEGGVVLLECKADILEEKKHFHTLLQLSSAISVARQRYMSWNELFTCGACKSGEFFTSLMRGENSSHSGERVKLLIYR